MNSSIITDVPKLVEHLENFTIVDVEDSNGFTEFDVKGYLCVTVKFCIVYLITSLFILLVFQVFQSF